MAQGKTFLPANAAQSFSLSVDGVCVEESISLTDLGFLFGHGVFTSIRIDKGKPRFLSLHLKRLQDHARFFKLVLPPIPKEIIYQLIKQFDGKLKIILTGSHRLFFQLSPYMKPAAPLKVMLYPTPIISPLAHLKTLSYNTRFWIQNVARESGFDDAIVQDPSGHILETSFANLFWIKEKELFTPCPTLPLFFGITIQVVLRKAARLGYKISFVKQKKIPQDARGYCCNSLMGILPINQELR